MSKKLIIIIVAVLLLLGGAGAGYYFFMHKGEPAAEHEDTEHGEGDKKKASKKPADKHGEASESDTKKSAEAKEPMYLDLMVPMIVNFPKGSGASLIQVSVSFLTDSEETATSLKKHEPMLRNNLMMKVNAQNPEALKTKAGKETLRTVMLEEVNQILSKVAEGGRVKEVFFTAFVMQ